MQPPVSPRVSLLRTLIGTIYKKEEDWEFALDDNEWKGDEPVFVSFLYREGKEVGFIREYFGKRVRVVKRYMYADYGGRDAALRESFRDDAFRSFLNKHVYGNF